ncbi:hypothetical protein FRB97_001926 [Tulasnella sp. 331]|nr:hypothetical protein FRB97_001926 [Tulasnella sp. 331]
MVTLTAAQVSNAAFTASYRPVALFVGGTAGVGQGTAEAFARATKGNAHIMICGRSKASADKIMATFPQTPESNYEFIECDVSLMKNVVATTSAIMSRVSSLNYLVLSQGILTMQGFTPTSEGIDMKLSLHFYSRWKFVSELMPLLENAKTHGQEARVMTILHTSRGQPLLEDNLGLKRDYSMRGAAGQSITYNNLMIEEYAKTYPQMSFTHIYPGVVNTSLARNLHWSLRLLLGVFVHIFITSTPYTLSMVTLAVAQASNATFTAAYHPVALFVGGTAGVGQGTAQAFARATNGNAHIMICGRSKARADEIIAALPTTPESKYEFIECDVSLMKNVAATASTIKSRISSLNYLVLSQGILTMQGFTPTSEGIDMKLSLHFYSRWKFVSELMPLLENAKVHGQEARVMTVLHASLGEPLLEDNLGLKRNYSIAAAAGQAITYNNLMEYARAHPQMSFAHIAPGAVNTSLTRNLHWSLKPLLCVASLVLTSLEDCGEWMLYPLLSPAYRQGAFYLDKNGEPVPSKTILTSDAARKILVEHFMSKTST